MMTFEEWMGEICSLLTREEKAFQDLVLNPHEEPADQMESIKDWLRDAYNAGRRGD